MANLNPPRRRRLRAAVAFALGGLVSAPAAHASAVVQLSSLDGTNGFRLDGVGFGDHSGRAVSAAGDINGDGIDDLIIGAHRANPNSFYSGSSYVVFGNRDLIFADGFAGGG